MQFQNKYQVKYSFWCVLAIYLVLVGGFAGVPPGLYNYKGTTEIHQLYHKETFSFHKCVFALLFM